MYIRSIWFIIVYASFFFEVAIVLAQIDRTGAATQPSKDPISLVLYTTDASLAENAITAIIEITNNSSEDIEIWKFPVLQSWTFFTTQDIGPKKISTNEPLQLSIMFDYTAAIEPLDQNGHIKVLENSTGFILWSDKTLLRPYSSIYVKTNLDANKVKNNIRVRAQVSTKFGSIRSNEIRITK